MNKNSKQRKAQLRLARRAGKREVTLQVPVHNYHSNAGLTGKTFHVAGGGGVVSQNTKRNMRMRILTNAGGGKGSSLTVHEKINDKEPANPKPRVEDKNKRLKQGNEE